MKCAVVTPHRLGIPEMAERVGREWEAMGHNVDYILAEGEAARLGPITVGAPGIALWWYRTLKRLASDGARYDLIWTHQPVAPFVPSDAPAFWDRVVATIHTTLRREYQLVREGVYPARLRPYYWLVKSLEHRFHQRLAASTFDGPHYTVVSPHLRNELVPMGIDDSTYIPNGVFTPDSEDHGPIRDEYEIPDDVTLVFNIGSLTHQKRADRFAELMGSVTTRHADIHCVVAGDGPLRKSLDRHASNRLHVLGYVEEAEKWRWFADADVFASLSAYEGMPVATTEALSFGLPVVLSDIPAHRHLLETYDAAGRLVGDDPSEIATAIMEVRSDRSDVTLPSWNDVARVYLDLIRET